MPRPFAVALTGGIGAGKSEALKAFARHGAATISADEIVHALLRDDRELQEDVFAELGVRIARGDADERAALARRVFGDPQSLERLERLLHPRVRAEEERWLATVDAPLAVAEIPLLYETGSEHRFDAVVVVTAPAAMRSARKDLPDLGERERRLIPDEEKVERADFVYVNDGSVEDLDEFVAGVVAAIGARGG